MVTIPTLNQLYTDIVADLQTELGFTIPVFGPIFLRALAMVQAAKLKLFYLAIANLQKNIFVDTADSQANGGTLERFGVVKLGRLPFAAVAGQYLIQFTGTVGATIPAGTVYKSDDDAQSPGKLFILDNAFTITNIADVITVRALEPGLDSRLQQNDTLTATAPIAGASSAALVIGNPVPPLAAESIEDYRSKAIDAYRLEAQGGAATDYRLWSADAQGVRYVYPYAKSGAANEINLYVEATVADSTDGKGTPSAQLLLDVEAVVEFDPDTTRPTDERGRRPLGVFQVHYLPVTIREVDVNINGFVGLDAAAQTAITNALTTDISSIRPFVAGADILAAKNDILDTNRIISTVLSARPGSTFGTITLMVAGTTYNTYTFLNGDIPNVRNITFV